jgi:hypothetical protein
MRQQASALKENLASISKKMKQVSDKIEPMRSKLAELNSEVLADAVTPCGIKYFCRRKVSKNRPSNFFIPGTLQMD